MDRVMRFLPLLIVLMLSLPAFGQVGARDESFPYDEEDPVVGMWLGQVYLEQGPAPMSMRVQRSASGQLETWVSIPPVGVYQDPCREIQEREGGFSTRLPDSILNGRLQWIIRSDLNIGAEGQQLTGTLTFDKQIARLKDLPTANIVLHRTPRPVDLAHAMSFSGEVLHGSTPYKVTAVIGQTPGGFWVGHVDIPRNSMYGLFAYGIEFEEDDHFHLVTSDRTSIMMDLFPSGDGRWEGQFTRQNREDMWLERDPYVQAEMKFKNSQGDDMSGTLSIPDSKGPHPCVVIASTFGPHDRDGVTLTHTVRAYQRLADQLVKSGYAVLRIDERSMRRSGGDFTTMSTADCARDLNRAIHQLKKFGAVDPERIGVLGHGEGGVVAALVNAIGHHDLAFVALMGAPVDAGGPTVLYQRAQAMDLAGEHPQTKRSSIQISSQILEAVARDVPEAEIRTTLAEFLEGFRKELPADRLAELPPLDEEVEQRIGEFLTPWMSYWLKLNIPAMYNLLDTPVFAAYGSLDKQVNPEKNAKLVEQLAAANGLELTLKRYDGRNHLFQVAKTGGDVEYRTLGDAFDDEVIADLVAWLEQVAPK